MSVRDAFAALTNMMRSAMDDHLNTRVLERHTTAFAHHMMNPITQVGRSLQFNLLVGTHDGQWTNSGTTPWSRALRQVFASGSIPWARFIKSMNVDGMEYELQTGKTLDAALDAGNFSVGEARTLVAYTREELMAVHREIERDINKAIHRGGTIPGSNDQFYGYQQITAPETDWGGFAYDHFGQHEWDSILLGDTPPYINNPITKDMGGQPFSIFGDFENLMIDLNHGGSKSTAMGIDQKYICFVHQRVFSDILKHDKMRGVLRRSVGPTADADISGFTGGGSLYWDAYNLEIKPDSDAPVSRVVVFNEACVRLAQVNKDQRFMRKWRLGSAQDTVLVPFAKSTQLWCDDRSQTGALYNIGKSANGDYVDLSN